MKQKEKIKQSPEINDILDQDISEKRFLILFNDDYNTFDFVIETLIEVCKHDVYQAEQCAFIVHNKGKCDVKRGSLSQLKPLKDELINRGLTASIN
jgi:ATP-dependent Clp protease adaptor protein ClpS